MAPQPLAPPPRRPVAATLLLGGAAVLAAAALSGARARTEPSVPSLTFLVSSSLPRTGASRPGQELSSVIAGAAGLESEARDASSVAMRGKRMKTWNVKQIKNAFYAKRNPKPVMPQRELKKRVTKVKLMRRIDEWATEFYVYHDPRDEQYQWSVPDVKRIFENPDFVDDDRLRESLGVPLAPIRMYATALEKMRGERLQASARTATELDDKEQKKLDKGVDLSTVDDEFLAFKGIELSKKEKAKRAQNRAQKRGR